MREESDVRERMCEAGAEGYLLKIAPFDELLAAIRGESRTQSAIPCEPTV
jgi:DNA-binding NarL/FixJ family response regulator